MNGPLQILQRAVSILGLLALAACMPAPMADATVLSDISEGERGFQSAGSLERHGGRLSFGAPLSLSGTFRLPSGQGPFPAVILAHGCNGIGNTERGWANSLHEWGYATFILDSFRGRGLSEVCTMPGTLNAVQRVPDVYGALHLLAGHPRIDAARIALMGFSHGGSVTLAAATDWAKEAFARPGMPSFRAFLPFYPACNAAYPERERVSAPVRVHAGAADDWTLAAPCVDLVGRLRRNGFDAAIHVYPGAHHAFDNQRPVRFLPQVSNASDCAFSAPSILGPSRAETGGTSCIRKGATVGGNPEALAAARNNLRAELQQFLR